jgi:deoxyribodipyrimidine photo-lyase
MTTSIQTHVPALRIRPANTRSVREDGARVVYWMIASRRVRFNFALQRAADWSRHLGLPLVILEAIRSDYPWASDRLHRFVADGMADTAAGLEARSVTYLPYVEPSKGAGRGLLEALSADAAVVVTDDFPTFFLPSMVTAAAAKIPILLEAVDSNGLLPMAAADREFATAYSFRRFLQKNLLDHLDAMPLEDPLAEDLPSPHTLPAAIARRWPSATAAMLAGEGDSLTALPIDHSVAVAPVRGGSLAAGAALRARPRSPAAFPPTFISVIFLRTRSFSRSCVASAGRPRMSSRRRTAGAPDGGPWAMMPRRFSTSS